ncbi:MAG: peptidoglycan DD-metalloendopeptidase family protein [Candidatus Atribacteria bacterium]|nr:peptidoglycan DD-metalloendopeptidase family protein [Candidatus Atribacteria bacterium]
MYKQIPTLILVFLLIISASPVSAQTPTPPPGPIYIVQEDDYSLSDIASRFNVSLADIVAINNITNPDIIFPGEKLIIPGLEGLSGTLVTEPVPFGETLRSLSRQYRMDPAVLRKLNHIVSPTELYTGYGLVVLQQENQSAWAARSSLGKGDTLLELAVRGGSDPWTVAQINGLAGPYAGLPGDVLYLPSGASTAAPTGLPASIASAEVDPLPITQGATVQVVITAAQPVTLSGLLVDHPLHFFPQEDGSQLALQGVHAMTDPGLYPLRIDITLPDGSVQSFEQMVLVATGDFPSRSLTVDSSYIDPAVTVPEDAWLLSLVTPVTPEKYWQGMFQMPVANDAWHVTSDYGERRTYNGGALYSFHTGIDFSPYSPSHPLGVYAPADGVVVFSGLQTVRGNAIIIDHGQGVYSGLYHQAEIYVNVGDHVTAGQLIGKIGDTGRVTGPHLHWDLWVNGIQVNPTPWLNETFPH